MGAWSPCSTCSRQTVTSPWVYLVIFVVTAVDAFFPAVPGETVVITRGGVRGGRRARPGRW